MENLKEVIVNVEIASLAKNLGLNIDAGACYFDNKFYVSHNFITLINPELKGENYKERVLDKCIFAPTQSLLQKWLRDTHKINLYCYPYKDHAADNNDSIMWKTNYTETIEFNTYEEALDKGLIKALKLISNK